MGIGSFFKNPFKLHKSVIRHAAPGNVKKNTYSAMGWDDPPEAAPYTGLSRNPDLQRRLEAYGVAERIAAARERFNQEFGGNQGVPDVKNTGPRVHPRLGGNAMGGGGGGMMGATMRGLQNQMHPAKQPRPQPQAPQGIANRIKGMAGARSAGQQMSQPPQMPAPTGAAGLARGGFQMYRDGGKVMKRKPNGKPC